MKRADDLFRRFGVKSALLVERDGLLYTYQSHSDFPSALPSEVFCGTTPGHFISAAEQNTGKTFSVNDVEKSWRQRKRGSMKKANDLFQLFGAKSALLVERYGLIYAYQSQADFPPILPGMVEERTSPKNFITAAEDEEKPNTPPLGVINTHGSWGKDDKNESTIHRKDKYRVTKSRKEIGSRTYFTRLGAARDMERR